MIYQRTLSVARKGWTRVAVIAVALALFAAAISQAEAARYAIHQTNFYLLSKNGDLFYPVVANAGHLVREEARMEAELDRLAEHGVNAVRIAVDDALAMGAPLDAWETPDGVLREEVLARLDRFFDAAQSRDMAVILILFDLQRMEDRWPNHRLHVSQGGPCVNLKDFIAAPEMRQRAQRLIRQLARRYHGRGNLLAWEIARGANLDELPSLQSREFSFALREWLAEAGQTLRQADRSRRLTAVSSLPNTLPFRIIQAADIVLLSIRSSNVDAAAESLPHYLKVAQERRKPVFVAEAEWRGAEDQRSTFYRTMSMMSMAQSSAMFFSPVASGEGMRFASDDLRRTLALTHLYLPLLRLDGEPRPPSQAPIVIRNADQYTLHETIIGSDRIFWLRRNEAGREKAQLTFHTVQGLYEYQWLDLEELQVGPNREFMLIRTDITLESPEFEQDIIGVLRLIRRPDDSYRIELPTR